VREHHFAHSSGREPCGVNHESLLHRYAKQVIAQAYGLVTPPHSSEIVKGLALKIQNENESWLALTGIEVEQAIGDIRPDLMGYTDFGLQIAIEVAYSSFCDSAKVARFQNLGLPALEIDLRAFTPDAFEPEAVKRAVLEGVGTKKWLWPKQEETLASEPIPQIFEIPTLSVEPAPTAPAKRRCPEEIVDVCGRWVSIKTLSSGRIAVKVIRYDHAVVPLVKAIARNHCGCWRRDGHSWIIEQTRADAARQQLRDLSKTAGFVPVTTHSP
jgi:hypothetical protein